MANTKKIEASSFPVVFGEKTRPAEVVTDKTTLDKEGMAFENYAPKKGLRYRFTTFEDAVIKRQPVTENGNGYQFLILCESSTDGQKWQTAVFNLNSLAKRDLNNVPCHPTWYELGSIGKRAQRLCEIGEIQVGTEKKTVKVPKEFVTGPNGRPTPARDASGEIIPKDSDYYEITPAI